MAIPPHFLLFSAFSSIVHKWVSEEKQREIVGELVLAALHNYLSMFPLDVSVTVTPVSVLKGNMAAWSVPASITQWELTARDVTLSTRTDPGPGPLGIPPMSVWVSSWTPGRCHKPTACTRLHSPQGRAKFELSRAKKNLYECTTFIKTPAEYIWAFISLIAGFGGKKVYSLTISTAVKCSQGSNFIDSHFFPEL